MLPGEQCYHPKEVHNRVRIERCRGTTFTKDILLLRLVNLITISISIFFKALFRIQRGDIVLVVTNPPLLPYIVGMACHLRGAKCVLRLDDVYPEILIATGMASPQNWGVRILGYMTKRLYRNVERIVVIGRDMEKLAQRKLGPFPKPITIIPNWADIDLVVPMAKKDNQLLRDLKLENKFIVLCAGNMGRAQGIENMFAAIKLLKESQEYPLYFYRWRCQEKMDAR